ncbi:hypothetical protein Pint_29879 [Pistacia integerrima]|uniref:Uncharacterized protein n=1 Tax=Pistacia integerrima TaxID=434235 RepID=A0ACC0X0T0_9ROSI|nr:hypothetical protein Pint_29879 [Pistacia integerrima]
MSHLSDIKLIRTDTTLDLSPKAEKVMLFSPSLNSSFIPIFCFVSSVVSSRWGKIRPTM